MEFRYSVDEPERGVLRDKPDTQKDRNVPDLTYGRYLE